MASLSFTFSLSALPVDQQQAFLTRFTELVSEYQMLTAPVPASPPAESLPLPSFHDGDGGAAPTAPVAVEEKPLEKMTNQELRDCLADLTGKPRGKKINRNFTNKASLIAEITRLRGAASVVERRPSEDSLEAPAAAAADSASEASSKKERKWRWADMTPEEITVKKAEIAARLKAGREAKKAARAAAAASAAAPAPAAAPAAGLARLSAQANAIQSSFLSAVNEARALFEASPDKRGRAWTDLSPEEKNTYVVRVWTGGVV